MCATAGSATAATLTAATECRWYPGAAECTTTHVVTYGGGAEGNRVLVASGIGGPGSGLQVAVVLYDPGVPITASGVETPQVTDPLLPSDPEDLDLLPVSQTRSCLAPTGKSVGLCWGTPGRTCALYLGCTTDVASFWVIELALGGGADKLRLTAGSLPAEVTAGAGNDTIDSHNQAIDYIDCGDGVDTVKAEQRDVVYSTCEHVTRGLGLK